MERYENTFVREVKEKNITDPSDILNWYRNLYHTEDNHTEHGIVAYAINDFFTEVEQLKRNLEQCENGYRQEMHLLQCKLAEAEIKNGKPFLDYAKLHSQIEGKITTIYKLSGLTLDAIIEKLAKGYRLMPTISLDEIKKLATESEDK